METANSQLTQFFEWLLWTTIQGSVMIVLIVLVQIVLRHRLPIRLHYFLWVLLLIRLAIPWLPESKISIFNLVPQTFRQGQIIESFTEPQKPRDMGFPLFAEYADTQEAKPEDNSESVLVKFMRTVPLLWLVGVVVMAGYVCARNISLWLIVKRERPITDQEILDLLEECKMQMGVQTILGVIVSDRIKSPALFGFVRPRLLLPQGMLETYNLEELRYVFIHELAHLKQRDIYFGWLVALLQIAHWFNPLMWFAFARMRADRELACDRLAISMMDADEPHKYGRTIVSLLESFSQVRYLPSVAGILEDTCQIERRIKMIADNKKTSRPQWAGAMLLIAVLACVVLTNAYVAKADIEFGEPTNLGPLFNPTNTDNVPACISADGLSLFFSSNRPPGGYRDFDLWVATRQSQDDDWSAPVRLGDNINSRGMEFSPYISSDGLELFFAKGSWENMDIWVTTRASCSDAWETPVNLGSTINSRVRDVTPCISSDELELYFSSERAGGHGDFDLYIMRRSDKEAMWSNPVNLGPTVNSVYADAYPSISADGLTLFFGSDQPPGSEWHADIWVTRRATINDEWGPPVNIGPAVNSSQDETAPNISADGSTLYFTSAPHGGFGPYDLWQVSILPIVDFNGDGNIDTDDLVILVEYWGTNEPLCDIGPTPLGDGIVDMKDLEVFISYWEQENMPEITEDIE